MGGEFWSWVGNTYLWLWGLYKINREHIVPLLTFVGAIILAWAALRQARNSTEQARTAAQQATLAERRHLEQIKTDRERTDADRQRRITDSFAKAVEQLGSDKLQVRLGGIYTLERISRESELDYWPIMETLTAFVRERARWKDEGEATPQTIARIYQVDQDKASQPSKPSLPTDIAAVLTVIKRREERNHEREKSEGWRLHLGLTDLRGADLTKAHLEGAYLVGAHLEGAFLTEAHLEKAYLLQAHLEEAYLLRAHLEGAKLREAKGLRQDQLDQAFGNAETQIPEGMNRPAHWPKQ